MGEGKTLPWSVRTTPNSGRILIASETTKMSSQFTRTRNAKIARLKGHQFQWNKVPSGTVWVKGEPVKRGKMRALLGKSARMTVFSSRNGIVDLGGREKRDERQEFDNWMGATILTGGGNIISTPRKPP